jgi:curved DNA-binding protein CbpA
VSAGTDPYAVLGVTRGASDAQIHAAYRQAVRRTHPDAGGDAAAFEAVQEAFEILRDPKRRAALDAGQPRPRPRQEPVVDPDLARRRMDDLIAESERLEDEARVLAGMPPRYSESSSTAETEDSVGAVLRDAGQQLRDTAEQGAREVRRFVRRFMT